MREFVLSICRSLNYLRKHQRYWIIDSKKIKGGKFRLLFFTILSFLALVGRLYKYQTKDESYYIKCDRKEEHILISNRIYRDLMS